MRLSHCRGGAGWLTFWYDVLGARAGLRLGCAIGFYPSFDGGLVDSLCKLGWRKVEFEMHAILPVGKCATPLKDLHAVLGFDRLDVRNHLRCHVGIGMTETHVPGTFLLSRLVGEADFPGARMVNKRVRLPVYVQRDAEGMKAWPGSAGDLPAVITVGVYRANMITVVEHDGGKSLPRLRRRWCDANLVGSEGHKSH
jgi:hypothetical protein